MGAIAASGVAAAAAQEQEQKREMQLAMQDDVDNVGAAAGSVAVGGSSGDETGSSASAAATAASQGVVTGSEEVVSLAAASAGLGFNGAPLTNAKGHHTRPAVGRGSTLQSAAVVDQRCHFMSIAHAQASSHLFFTYLLF